jgi:hypothetical protein
VSKEPLVSQTIAPANNFVWAVKTYLDLISGEGQLTPGSGLKRLYVMSAGVTTFNDEDIKAITQRALELKILPTSLRGFMNQSISKNIYLYGQELHRLIAARVVAISNGDVRNPESFVTFNADEARRHYYVPPVTFLKRLKKALNNDTAIHDHGLRHSVTGALVTNLSDVATDAELLLVQLQGQEGYSSPVETSWVYLMKQVEELVDLLRREANYSGREATYKNRARSALKILWVITKLLLGDLSKEPQRRDTNLVDLDQELNLSDGTLAAIPFPLQQTVKLFTDDDYQGVSMRGRMYLSAVSAAAFYRAPSDSE